MSYKSIFTLVMFAVAAISCASQARSQASPSMPPTESFLIGHWDVSLFYAPDGPPSQTEMVIFEAQDGKLTGSFYGTSFEVAHYSIRNDQLAFGAITSDGTGPYAHSGRWVGDRIEGQTLSTGRGFLMIWTATRRSR